MDSLEEIVSKTYASLGRAVVEKGHPWQWPVLSVGTSARIVVLRDFSLEEQSWCFFTDRRSAKVSLLRHADLNYEALFFDQNQGVQLRITGLAKEVEAEKSRRKHWERLSLYSRRSYASTHAPGHHINQPAEALTANWMQAKPTPAELEQAFENFTVYRCSIESCDYLALNRVGNQRAKWQPNTPDSLTWVVP